MIKRLGLAMAVMALLVSFSLPAMSAQANSVVEPLQQLFPGAAPIVLNYPAGTFTSPLDFVVIPFSCAGSGVLRIRVQGDDGNDLISTFGIAARNIFFGLDDDKSYRQLILFGGYGVIIVRVNDPGSNTYVTQAVTVTLSL